MSIVVDHKGELYSLIVDSVGEGDEPSVGCVRAQSVDARPAVGAKCRRESIACRESCWWFSRLLISWKCAGPKPLEGGARPGGDDVTRR